MVLNIKMFINKQSQLSVLSCFYVPWGEGGGVYKCVSIPYDLERSRSRTQCEVYDTKR